MTKRMAVLLKMLLILIVIALILLVTIRIVRQNYKDFTGRPMEEKVEQSIGTDDKVYVSYPEYTEEGVANGHFTGGFDLKTVLLGFRDKLDRGDFDVEIQLNKEVDFVLWQDKESREIHAVMVSSDGRQYAIATVGDAGIDRFPNLRQVHSFQIVSAESLDSFTESWEIYGSTDRLREDKAELESAYSSSMIKAEAGEVLLYHVEDKDSKVLLEMEDRELVESLFATVNLVEDITIHEPLNNVIKMESCKYMFDWSGAGIKDVYDDGTVLLGFELSGEELGLLEELYKKYGVYKE